MSFLDDFVLLAELDLVLSEPDQPELDSWNPPPREEQAEPPARGSR